VTDLCELFKRSLQITVRITEAIIKWLLGHSDLMGTGITLRIEIPLGTLRDPDRNIVPKMMTDVSTTCCISTALTGINHAEFLACRKLQLVACSSLHNTPAIFMVDFYPMDCPPR
jgi:hypothetical protein